MLKLEGISKDWKEFKIRNVDLEVKEEEYFIILGPSGAGKTLLLELIAGIHSPDNGKIYIDGRDVTELPPEKRDIAYIPQNYALFPHISVYDNIAYGLKIRGMRREKIKEIVEKLAEVLGISHLLHRKPTTLSGGEQQRVAIARALAVKPKILLLDEPFSNLDVQIRSKLIREMRRWQKEFKFTAIHVTHSFEEAIALGSRIGIMLKGRLVQIGKSNEIFLNPKNEEVARFLGYENVFDGYADGNIVRVGNVRLAIASSVFGKVKVFIRPEDIVISKERGEFEANVELIESFGFASKVILRLNGLELKALTTTAKLVEDGINEGDRVYVSFRSIRVLDSG
jgi:molybdate/tungstate transport system ATP-binding protein